MEDVIASEWVIDRDRIPTRHEQIAWNAAAHGLPADAPGVHSLWKAVGARGCEKCFAELVVKAQSQLPGSECFDDREVVDDVDWRIGGNRIGSLARISSEQVD